MRLLYLVLLVLQFFNFNSGGLLRQPHVLIVVSDDAGYADVGRSCIYIIPSLSL